MAEAEGFFSRWSRRKASAGPGPATAEVSTPAPAMPVAQTVRAGKPHPAARQEQEGPLEPMRQVGQEPAAPATLPTLDDVQGLQPHSDFRPFMARGVQADVKNAALKKLFADPHFNAMDGLDVYIDDYSRPDPLPVAMLRQMASAQFMKLVDAPGPAGVPPAESPDSPGAANLTECEALSEAQPEPFPDAGPRAAASLNPDHHDAHADLRLQPYPSSGQPGPDALAASHAERRSQDA